jgi:hypothetical protein
MGAEAASIYWIFLKSLPKTKLQPGEVFLREAFMFCRQKPYLRSKEEKQ